MSTSKSLGELMYEGHFKITGVTEYGASLAAIMSGEAPPPPTGLRVDVAFEGPVTGRVAGTMRGVDYLNVRADGRTQLDVRGSLVTEDDVMIACAIGGVAHPADDAPTTALREHVQLTTAAPEYAWVNELELWGVGKVDLAAGTIDVEVFG